ncbi:hypothetical protein [Tsuneonella sp. SYSU-LHT278]|uniref:hypothetical protein n=1 Tax=Tsuneonella sediminis TaxID=3416089 RepID=UPI003F7A626C
MDESRSRRGKTARLVALAAIVTLGLAWAVHYGKIMVGTEKTGAGSTVIGADPAYPLKIALPPSAPPARPPEMDSTFAPTPAPEASPARSEETGAAPQISRIREPSVSSAGQPGQARIPPGFDIRNFGSGGAAEGGIVARTTKPVFLGGRSLGAIELAVGQGASISVDRRALSALLADRAPTLSAALERETSDMVTLDALRTRDVAIRYDPLRDALLIDTRS